MKKAPNPRDYFDLSALMSEDPTVTTVLCGIRLRALRKHYFGRRSSNCGPPMKLYSLGEFKTWAGMVRTLTGINAPCAAHWIRLANAFELLSEREGISLGEVLGKPPWEWSAKESDRVNSTVHKLCKWKTQKQILKPDSPN